MNKLMLTIALALLPQFAHADFNRPGPVWNRFMHTATCSFYGANQCSGGCTAMCPQGFVVTGGGGSSNNTYVYLRSSQPTPNGDGWSCAMDIDRSYSCTEYGGVAQVNCFARCIRAQ